MQRFRNSFTHREGLDDAKILSGRIVNVNLANWTVDFRSQFDRYFFKNIQVGSPYMHYNRGEGLSIFPEVGAVCSVVLPSDSSPPYVASFLMPFEVVDTSADDAPLGTEPHGAPAKYPTTASFAGGRPRAKPGDISLRTRDQNFLILHRGGVLQIGATELAQRIYLPLQNHVMDVSQNYSHHNVGGAIQWRVEEHASADLPTEFIQTFRVFANDDFADIRFAAGKVRGPMPEPTGDDGETLNLQKLGIGTDKDSPIVYEVVIAPKGFDADSGDIAGPEVRKQTVIRYFFDRRGGAFLRCMGNVLLSFKKKLFLHVTDEMTVQAEKNIAISAKTGIDMNGGQYTHIKGDIVRFNGGAMPVARQGDMTRMMVPTAMIDGTVAGSPFKGLITFVTPLYGTIISGNSRVLA